MLWKNFHEIVLNILNFWYYKGNQYHSVSRMIFEEPKKEEKIKKGIIEEELNEINKKQQK